MIEDNEMKKMKKERNAMSTMVDIFAEMTKDDRVIYFRDTKNLSHKLNDLSIVDEITDNQYKELSNLVNQFNKVIDDYLTENNIELKEEE